MVQIQAPSISEVYEGSKLFIPYSLLYFTFISSIAGTSVHQKECITFVSDIQLSSRV